MAPIAKTAVLKKMPKARQEEVMKMSNYFVLITGSRSIQKSENIPLLIDSLIKRGVQIIVGDAPGVDRLVVSEAVRRGYGRNVTVVGAYGKCRNSFAFGKVGKIITLSSTYLARNLYMIGLSKECFAIWDGKSRGTKFTFECAKRAGLSVSVIYEKGGDE
jgi:hypothetical protein